MMDTLEDKLNELVRDGIINKDKEEIGKERIRDIVYSYILNLPICGFEDRSFRDIDLIKSLNEYYDNRMNESIDVYKEAYETINRLYMAQLQKEKK